MGGKAGKACVVCGKRFPFSEFYENPQALGRPPSQCKACKGKCGAAKYCPNCDCVKPVTEFGRNKSRFDGLSSRCSACERSRSNKINADKRAIRGPVSLYVLRTKTNNRAWMRYLDSRTSSKDLTLRGTLRRWHAIGGVKAIYNQHSYAEEQREWMAKWGAKLMALVG